MLLTILLVLVSVSLFIRITVLDREDDPYDENGGLMAALAILLGLCIAGVIACLIGVAVTQTSKSATHYKWQEERAYLVDTYNVYRAEYSDDLVHIQSLKDINKEIYEFNTKLNENEYFSNNIWLSWFYIGDGGIEKIEIVNGVAK